MPDAAEVALREGRGAFGGFIGPRMLRAQVENTAPWLFDARAPEQPYVALLRGADRLPAAAKPTPAERTDYFALCLAAHFASAATYVPTDVDTKIRRALWQDARGTDELPRMCALALELAGWDPEPVSARVVRVAGAGAVSGHDGERLAVLAGGFAATRSAGLEAAIDTELCREARAFEALEAAPGAELELLRLAAVLTHNAGDLQQGLGTLRHPRFADLARSGPERFGGAFARAAALYRELLAQDGHRNYPLRKVRALRSDRALLLPLAPCLDDWGERLARFPGFGDGERAEVISALVDGCRKLPGQTAYHRALAGLDRALPRGLAAPELTQHYSVSVRRELREPELRRLVAVRRESFEASLAKRTREALRRPRA
ncbi:MAG TPA: hypothetical protein VMR31_12720 [Myxococcota bacterium]|nr:hypothetical protein [Myxococcota bacterium]